MADILDHIPYYMFYEVKAAIKGLRDLPVYDFNKERMVSYPCLCSLKMHGKSCLTI